MGKKKTVELKLNYKGLIAKYRRLFRLKESRLPAQILGKIIEIKKDIIAYNENHSPSIKVTIMFKDTEIYNMINEFVKRAMGVKLFLQKTDKEQYKKYVALSRKVRAVTRSVKIDNKAIIIDDLQKNIYSKNMTVPERIILGEDLYKSLAELGTFSAELFGTKRAAETHLKSKINGAKKYVIYKHNKSEFYVINSEHAKAYIALKHRLTGFISAVLLLAKQIKIKAIKNKNNGNKNEQEKEQKKGGIKKDKNIQINPS